MAKIYSKGARMYEVGKEKQQALSGESACSAAMDRGEQVDKGQDATQSRGVQPAQLLEGIEKGLWDAVVFMLHQGTTCMTHERPTGTAVLVFIPNKQKG